MLSSTVLAATDDFTVRAVTCADDHRQWSAPEPCEVTGIVLVRSGAFRVRSDGRETIAETTTGYVQVPGRDLQFAHPAGGDVCTSVTVSTGFWPTRLRGHTVRVSASLELAHLMLVRAARNGDPHYAVAERLLSLLGRAEVRSGGDPARSVRADRLVRAAQEAVLADDPHAATLAGLARRLGVSPYHLSRVFSAHTGGGLTRYRNRVRVSRALHRLRDGEEDLARLAAELGFADQAHLTRTIKAHVGSPPAALRRLLR